MAPSPAPAADDSGIEHTPANPDSLAPELQSFESSNEARRLADVDLLSYLALQGYDGSDYDTFADLLARYGIAVIGKWCRDNSIFGRCLQKGYPVTSFGRPIGDLLEELTYETVAKALLSFRERVLIPGHWDPNRGASLKTFFIGHCLQKFPVVYRDYFRKEQVGEHLSSDHEEFVIELDDKRPANSPHDDLDRKEAMRDAINSVPDPKMRCVLLEQHDGHSMEQIAERCGLTVPAVKSKLNYFKQKLEQTKGRQVASID